MPGPRPVAIPIRTWMIAYDIADDTRRLRVARALLGFGERVQRSVFECRLDAREVSSLRQRVNQLIDQGRDSVRWYPLCRPCSSRIVQQGAGGVSQDVGFYLV